MRARFTTLLTLAALGAAVGVSLSALHGAMAPAPPREIGLLAVGEQTYQSAFWRGLERNGLVDGRNIQVRRAIGSGNPADLTGLAADLVRHDMAAIVATSSAAVEAALKQTKTIPIISVTSADPLASGFIQSYSKPGGNVTGLAGVEPAVAPKSLQLLQLAAPDARRIAVFWNPTHPLHPSFLDGVDAYARQAGLTIVRIKVEGPLDVAKAFTEIDAQSTQALLVLVDPAINRSREEIVRLANARRAPAMYPLGEFTAAGGLMSYGVDYADLHDRAADYVAQVLAGAKPGDLPMERPLNFELVVNLETADALSLRLPAELLLRARTIRPSRGG